MGHSTNPNDLSEQFQDDLAIREKQYAENQDRNFEGSDKSLRTEPPLSEDEAGWEMLSTTLGGEG